MGFLSLAWPKRRVRALVRGQVVLGAGDGHGGDDGGVPFREITALLGQSSSGETERYVHRLPDQFLARRARVAIDHAFPACGPAPTGQVSGEADTASRSGAADFAD
jgi:hypothetical protein